MYMPTYIHKRYYLLSPYHVPRTSHAMSLIFSIPLQVRYSVPILQMKKLRLKEIKHFILKPCIW